MSHPLDDCIAKLNRADVHIQSLDDTVRAFVHSGAYGVETDVDPQSFEYILRGRVFREVPARDWGPMIGDAVNNLRSALDNLVWQLSVHYQRSIGQPGPPPDPIPYRNHWRHVRFPIFVQPGWAAAEAKNLWGIRPGLGADFERLQPFFTGQQRQSPPDREPLAVLEELWNIDKHRHLHLAQCFVGLRDMTSRFRDLMPPEVKLPDDFVLAPKITLKRFPGPFEDGAELARYSELGGNIIVAGGPMYMEAQLEFGVAFDQGAPAYGAGLIETLTELSKLARAIVVQFESEFP